MRKKSWSERTHYLRENMRGFQPKIAARRLLLSFQEGWYAPGDEQSANRFCHLRHNYSANVVANLIGGNFFTGLLLLLGATDGFIGLISIVTFSANLLQFIAPLLIERFPSRKKLIVGGKILVHLFNIVMIGIIPFLPLPQQGQFALLFIGVLVVNVINALIAPGITIWFIQFLPNRVRARYFSLLSMTNGIIVALVNLGASGLVDLFKGQGMELGGLTLLRVAALAIAAFDVWLLTRMKEYPYEQDQKSPTLFQLLIEPFKQKLYLRTVATTFLWNAVANMPGAYYTVYLLRDVGVSYSFITLVSLINIPVLLFLTPIWSKVLQRLSWMKTLIIALLFYLTHYVLLAFVTNHSLMLYPLAMLIAFVFAAGINLSFSGIPYVNIPKKNQTVYIGFYSTIANLGALLGITIGREFITRSEELTFTLMNIQFGNKQILVGLVSILMLGVAIALHFLHRNVPLEE